MELKESRSRGRFRGILEEKNLTFDTDDKGEIIGIKGDIVVSNETGSYSFRVFSKAKNNQGQPNKLYSNYVDVKNDFVSRAEATQINGTPTEVEVDYTLRPNNYVNKQGVVTTALNYQTIFIRKPKVDSAIKEDSALDITGSVLSTKKSEDKKYSTVTIAVVGYNGDVSPVELSVETEDFDEIATICQKGETIQFACELRKEHVESAPKSNRRLAFGRAPKIRSGYDVVRLCIIGLWDGIEEDDEEYLPPDEIEQGLIERESIAVTKKDTKVETKGTDENINPEVQKIMSSIADDEIPF